jgi:hypothetical protein
MTEHFLLEGEEVAIRKVYFLLIQNFSANRHFFPLVHQIHPVIPNEAQRNEESHSLIHRSS